MWGTYLVRGLIVGDLMKQTGVHGKKNCDNLFLKRSYIQCLVNYTYNKLKLSYLSKQLKHRPPKILFPKLEDWNGSRAQTHPIAFVI